MQKKKRPPFPLFTRPRCLTAHTNNSLSLPITTPSFPPTQSQRPQRAQLLEDARPRRQQGFRAVHALQVQGQVDLDGRPPARGGGVLDLDDVGAQDEGLVGRGGLLEVDLVDGGEREK